MGLRFEELDATTREHMLAGFEEEKASGQPFVGADLSPAGQDAFLGFVREALENGDDDTLTAAFDRADYWQERSPYRRKDGSVGTRKVNVGQRARLLGLSEFNTWYVRGLAGRLLDEGVASCQIYRAGEPLWAPARECLAQEDRIVPVQHVYDGHRARYWPARNPDAFSVPIVPGCHHTIRRA